MDDPQPVLPLLRSCWLGIKKLARICLKMRNRVLPEM